MEADLRLRFGEPKHGWLPLHLQIGGQVLEFSASDVNTDGLEGLCNALLNLQSGREGEVDWFLEPGSYLFRFTPVDQSARLDIYLIERRTQNGKSLSEKSMPEHSWIGEPSILIKTFWRGLKDLEQKGIDNTQWKRTFLRRWSGK